MSDSGSVNNNVSGVVQRFLDGGGTGMVRVPPEPKSRLAFDFSSILSSVGAIAGSAMGISNGGGIQPQYMSLLNKQMEMQEQMQLVSLTSNVEKSRHESRMAAVRNIRAG